MNEIIKRLLVHLLAKIVISNLEIVFYIQPKIQIVLKTGLKTLIQLRLQLQLLWQEMYMISVTHLVS